MAVNMLSMDDAAHMPEFSTEICVNIVIFKPKCAEIHYLLSSAIRAISTIHVSIHRFQ